MSRCVIIKRRTCKIYLWAHWSRLFIKQIYLWCRWFLVTLIKFINTSCSIKFACVRYVRTRPECCKNLHSLACTIECLYLYFICTFYLQNYDVFESHWKLWEKRGRQNEIVTRMRIERKLRQCWWKRFCGAESGKKIHTPICFESDHILRSLLFRFRL